MFFQRPANRTIRLSLGLLALVGTTSVGKPAKAFSPMVIRQCEQHAVHKHSVLAELQGLSQLELLKISGRSFQDTWRSVLIDGPYLGVEKEAFLKMALANLGSSDADLSRALQALCQSHHQLFRADGSRRLMIRAASGPAFKPFGVHMSLAQAMARLTADSDAPVQAFRTIFETGQNTRGYVHKLECHAEAVEFIYAVTDIVYGVLLPSELVYGPEQVSILPSQVQMFYIKAGDVIALHPYVLHSGSLSVEPDRSFSIVIYKQPAQARDLVVWLPENWSIWKERLKLPGIDKYYLNLPKLQTGELEGHPGTIPSPRPIRLPAWP